MTRFEKAESDNIVFFNGSVKVEMIENARGNIALIVRVKECDDEIVTVIRHVQPEGVFRTDVTRAIAQDIADEFFGESTNAGEQVEQVFREMEWL